MKSQTLNFYNETCVMAFSNNNVNKASEWDGVTKKIGNIR